MSFFDYIVVGCVLAYMIAKQNEMLTLLQGIA